MAEPRDYETTDEEMAEVARLLHISVEENQKLDGFTIVVHVEHPDRVRSAQVLVSQAPGSQEPRLSQIEAAGMAVAGAFMEEVGRG